jgi:hypothetical protein
VRQRIRQHSNLSGVDALTVLATGTAVPCNTTAQLKVKIMSYKQKVFDPDVDPVFDKADARVMELPPVYRAVCAMVRTSLYFVCVPPSELVQALRFYADLIDERKAKLEDLVVQRKAEITADFAAARAARADDV